MTLGVPIWRRLRRQPYGPLILWMAVAGVLGAGLVGVHLFVVGPAQDRLAQAEAAWMAARQRIAQRLGAEEARKQVTVILNAVPGHRGLGALPMGLSAVAP